LNSFSFPYVGFCSLSQFSKVTQHTITPALHPPKLQKRHLLTGSGLELDSLLLKSPLALTFFFF
jgi:hypothetical protein